MAILKTKELLKMGNSEIEKKLKELKTELVKAKGNSAKAGNNKIREIKKAIARILTINNSKKTEEKSPVNKKPLKKGSEKDLLIKK